MDHKDAIKGFRPRASINTVIPRMAIVVDRFTDVHNVRKQLYMGLEAKLDESINSVTDNDDLNDESCSVFKPLTSTDIRNIIPLAHLILRINALCTDVDKIPKNLYSAEQKILEDVILDKHIASKLVNLCWLNIFVRKVCLDYQQMIAQILVKWKDRKA